MTSPARSTSETRRRSSILEAAEKIIKLTGSRSVINFKPLPDDDPKKRKPDITLARKILDWAPKVPLDDGLLKTITYFDDLLSNGNEKKNG